MDITQTATAAVDGTASVTLGPIPAGLQWVVSQISAETSVARSGSTVTVRKNGRFITATPLSTGSASAQGPPFIVVHPGDQLTCNFAGMTTGDVCFTTWLYAEQPWAASNAVGVV